MGGRPTIEACPPSTMVIQAMQAHKMQAAAAGWTSEAILVFPVPIKAITITIEKVTRKREMQMRIQSRGLLIPWAWGLLCSSSDMLAKVVFQVGVKV
jgi:hypothetical protein